jgi:hypothetical protein
MAALLGYTGTARLIELRGQKQSKLCSISNQSHAQFDPWTRSFVAG